MKNIKKAFHSDDDSDSSLEAKVAPHEIYLESEEDSDSDNGNNSSNKEEN